MIPSGRSFYKMSGSGNDFVMVDARSEPPGVLAEPEVIKLVCARGTGVGADGIVFVLPSDRARVRLVYLNADGSPADFCGNATLCTTRLAVELGAGSATGFDIETDSGIVAARMTGDRPEIDLQGVTDVRPDVADIPAERGESRLGFALVGVPHLVVLCDDVATIDVVGRGRPLRRHASLPHGANVNFVGRGADSDWRVRTYERGVEGETLACGSGAVATAILLVSWGLATSPVTVRTSSGRSLRISLDRRDTEWLPSLSGEARVVYEARFSEV